MRIWMDSWLSTLADRQRYSHEGECEVKPLSQAPEGDKCVPRKAACAHLTVGLLKRSFRTLAHKPTNQQVHTAASILTHTRHTAARSRAHLTVLTWNGDTG